ncbi:resuscitation-promoting factor [Occultella gossypii]|uniref:Transglycosylase family protein n=1 Tax=Occultella gossypii TaxID=2800820 RepID=A0ABS7S8K5_9MICO|nr:resuscitation-promoting factor [Occultella gossypii]MBZ2196683.1 transglycosylase family protein [Occultella gossypii]
MSLFSKKQPEPTPEPTDETAEIEATSAVEPDGAASVGEASSADAAADAADETGAEAPAGSFDDVVAGYAASATPDAGTTAEFDTDDAGSGSEHDAAAAGAKPRRRSRRAIIGIAAAFALVVGTGGAVFASAHKTIDVDVNGEIRTVTTYSGDIAGVLEQEGITTGEHDLIVPSLDEALVDGSDVVVRTAQEVTFEVNGETTDLWTTATTAGQAVADVAGAGRDIQITASRSVDGRAELELPLVTDGPVVFEVDGASTTVEIEGEATLDEALVQAGLTLSLQDTVAVTAREDGTPVVTITRRSYEPSVTTAPIAFESVERETDDLYVGQSRVVQEGADGVTTSTFTNQIVDGVVVSTKLLRTEVTDAVAEITEVGTAERPVAPPAPAPSSGGSSGGSSGSTEPDPPASTVGGDVWAALAQCESGGNPTIVSSNGLYHGLYQFSVGTWQSVGGSGLPSQASPAEQTQRAQALQARSGWGQWPHCSSVLGLR